MTGPLAAVGYARQAGWRESVWLPALGAASRKYSVHIDSVAVEGAFHFVFEMLLLHTLESHKGTLAGLDQINTCTECNIYLVNDI